MNKHDTMILELRNQLGTDYSIRTIDLERCLYRDFGNGFNVEISGIDTTNADKPAILYLWFGDEPPDCFVVKSVRNVKRSEIGKNADELFAYTEQLIRNGLANRKDLFRLAHPQLKTINSNKF